MDEKIKKKLIVVRGGGDLATGTIHRLWSARLPVLVLETDHPASIRRQVSISEAIYDGQAVVEGMEGIRIQDSAEAAQVIAGGKVPVWADPQGKTISSLRPAVVVDAILAKRNMGTHRGMAPLTIALGPGFEAGRDVDLVVETMRGHDLGRIIRAGCAMADTGIPGDIGGHTTARVIHAAEAGIFQHICKIGDIVAKGEAIGQIQKEDGSLYTVRATIPGLLRGLLRDGYTVPKGLKIADIDPRERELGNCFTISDKARCIGGSVLEAAVSFLGVDNG